MRQKKMGSVGSFDLNWRNSVEAEYIHWTRGEPRNQIQLAFRRHWITFSSLIKRANINVGKVLEVGCGRGSLSAYFADDGWDAHLLDISQRAIELAEKSFNKNSLTATFKVGDCCSLPYQDEEFDVIFSIGLLEHFQDFRTVLSEQKRVLKKGGLFLGYVVPKFEDNVQTKYDWICRILSSYTDSKSLRSKEEVFRSDNLSSAYKSVMAKLGYKDIWSSGIYPLPMISHSIDFPFSLMPEKAEHVLVDYFNEILETSKEEDPWLCEEGFGQAFLITARK
jgi:ubiquinone/menaquinone biosynthesis C-methylase UbiE